MEAGDVFSEHERGRTPQMGRQTEAAGNKTSEHDNGGTTETVQHMEANISELDLGRRAREGRQQLEVGDEGSEGDLETMPEGGQQCEVIHDKASEQELGRRPERSEEVEVPTVGMCFESEEEARNCYIKYAAGVGFAIRRIGTKSGDDGKLRYFAFACARSRKPTFTSDNSFRLRQSIKTDCKAKINLVVGKDGKLFVSKVKLDHNHPLSPGRMPYVRYHKKKGQLKWRIESNDRVSATENQSDHYISSATQLRLDFGDTKAIQHYFLTMQERNSDFFYLVDLNDQGMLRNVFWADARSRAAFMEFGDIIIFDTTCLVDKYDLPFVSFFGVNHHGQSLLLGCGLLLNENHESYMWLLRSWLACMSGCCPKVIITSQCGAIKTAIGEAFPKAHHLFSLWHIMKKILEKMEGLDKCHTIKKILKSVVYEAKNPVEFEERWAKMIEDYNLVNNEWLESIYADRHYWVPAFAKDKFSAGIALTQRCENINSFFDGCIDSNTSLKSFLEQYDNALRGKVEKEKKADLASSSAIIPLFSDLYIERQLQEVYTNENFKLFQDELKGLLYCNTSLLKSNSSVFEYEVTESVKLKDDSSRREIANDVLYKESDHEVQCSCCLFESRGILCRHAVAVLIKRNIDEIPSRYILPRWRKDIKRRYILARSSYDDFDSNIQMQRYEWLHNYFYQVVENGIESNEIFETMMGHLDEMRHKLLVNDLFSLNVQPPEELLALFGESDSEVLSGPTPPQQLSSPLKRRRGRPPKKLKEPMTQERAIANKKKTPKINLIQSIEDSSQMISATGNQSSPDILEANPLDSWTCINIGISANHQLLLPNHLQGYSGQLNEMTDAEFGGSGMRLNFSSGHFVQCGGLGSSSTSCGFFVAGGSDANLNNRK